jgi:Sec-independent protein translocase protein TatA
MKGLGKGVRSFRDGVKGIEEIDDDNKSDNTPTQTK